MVVNETGRDHAAPGVNDAGGGVVEPAHPDNLAAAHRNVGLETRPP